MALVAPFDSAAASPCFIHSDDGRHGDAAVAATAVTQTEMRYLLFFFIHRFYRLIACWCSRGFC